MSQSTDIKNDRRILEFLLKKQSATNTAIAKEFSLDEKQVNQILNDLRQEGFVQFQQELHLTRHELIMAKITGKGTTALQTLKVEPKPDNSGVGYDFNRISKAFEFASEAHKNEFRKGTTIPYIVHPLDVLSILLKNGASEDLSIAGLLHDVLEDTPRSREEIRISFGDSVGLLVEDASENEELTKGVSNEEKKKTWKIRKSQKIEKVRTSGRELRLLICADKLSNIRDLIEDLHSNGEVVWGKFNASKDQQSWYYHEIAAAMASPKGEDSDISQTLAYQELTRSIREVFGS
jgi:DNA-binding MarR family transcriptional regulator